MQTAPIVDFPSWERHNRFMVIDRVIQTIERTGMLSRGDRVLVAVSGGMDSVVLLDVLRQLASGWSLALTVAHLDHGLREGSPEDARFVESLATGYGIPTVSKAAGPADYEMHRSLGAEGAARAVRHGFLAAAAEQAGADHIALGHTATDRAETILFRLARGTGPTGLSGIRPVRGRFIRPLIDIRREEVEAYARTHALAWREDPSNQDLRFSRNRIRHRVMGELEQINPRAVEALCRSSDLVSELVAAADLLAQQVWPQIVETEQRSRLVLNRTTFNDQPPELRPLLLREAVLRSLGHLEGIERAHIRAACDMIASAHAHAQIDLPGLPVRVQADQIVLAPQLPEPIALSSPVDLGTTHLPELGVTIRLRIAERADVDEEAFADARDTEVADADRVDFPLHVRTRRSGDRFTPLGMKRPVKLKDFLINQRVPFYDRDRIPLLCDRSRILWVAGQRLAHEVRITKQTSRVLIMHVEEHS